MRPTTLNSERRMPVGEARTRPRCRVLARSLGPAPICARFNSRSNTTSDAMKTPPGQHYRALVLLGLFLCALSAQAPARKKLLIIGEEKGYRHEAVSHALATIERLGKQAGLWDSVIRTDTEALTKKKLEYNAKNLTDFDAVLFYTGGTLEMDDQQKADFLSFIRDDGKGFIDRKRPGLTPLSLHDALPISKNLTDFDAVLFYTGGTLEMDDQQKADFLSFIRDDGKGFIGVHSAADRKS